MIDAMRTFRSFVFKADCLQCNVEKFSTGRTHLTSLHVNHYVAGRPKNRVILINEYNLVNKIISFVIRLFRNVIVTVVFTEIFNFYSKLFCLVL